MSESTDTSTVKQKPKKVGERLKESIERFLLMRGLTSKDIIAMIDDVLANKAIKHDDDEDGDLRKIRERVALILEGLDETEIARIRKQVSLILAGKGVPSLTPLLFISRTLNVRLGTFLDGDSSKIENLRPAICRRQMVKDEVVFGDDDEQLIYHPLSMNKSGVSMEPYIIEMGTPTNIDKLMNDNEFKKKRLERHAGEEFIYVMKGRLVAQVGNETIMLDEGDSIYYHGYLPHHIFSNDRDAQGKPIKKTDILAVVYAPPLEDTLSIKQLNMNNRFGKTLMRLRQMMKLDVAEVSRRTGLKENVITAIEEGGKITSLMPLTRITQALGVRLWTIITNGLLRNYSVFRKADLEDKDQAKTLMIGNLTHHFLAINMSNRNMEPFFIEGNTSNEEEFELESREGEAFCYVLEGRIKIFIGSTERSYIIGKGESIYLDTTIPYHIQTLEDGTKTITVVYTPFTFTVEKED